MSVETRSILNARYVPTGVIGNGTYGHVLLAQDSKTGREVAIKVAHRQPAYRRSALNEVTVLRILNETSRCRVVKFIDAFEDDDRVHIVVELLGKNLYEVLTDRNFQGFPLEKLRNIAETILSGLATLHAHGYMHCDVKPENIMTTEGENVSDVKIIDFGSVRKVDTENAYFDIQSLWYRAPEVICGVPYTPLIDAWSVGCLLAELCTGNPLFAGDAPQQQLASIIETMGAPSAEARAHGKYSNVLEFDWRRSESLDQRVMPYLPHVPEADMFMDLLYCLLQPDENLRISCEEALEHPFITRQGWMGRGTFSARRHSTPSVANTSFYGMSDCSNSTTSSPERAAAIDYHALLISPTTSCQAIAPPAPIDDYL